MDTSVLTSRVGTCLLANINCSPQCSRRPEAHWLLDPLLKQRLPPNSSLGPKLWALSPAERVNPSEGSSHGGIGGVGGGDKRAEQPKEAYQSWGKVGVGWGFGVLKVHLGKKTLQIGC